MQKMREALEGATCWFFCSKPHFSARRYLGQDHTDWGSAAQIPALQCSVGLFKRPTEQREGGQTLAQNPLTHTPFTLSKHSETDRLWLQHRQPLSFLLSFNSKPFL